jgi:hypothetical protein
VKETFSGTMKGTMQCIQNDCIYEARMRTLYIHCIRARYKYGRKSSVKGHDNVYTAHIWPLLAVKLPYTVTVIHRLCMGSSYAHRSSSVADKHIPCICIPTHIKLQKTFSYYLLSLRNMKIDRSKSKKYQSEPVRSFSLISSL